MFSPTSGLPGIRWLRNTSNNRITNQLLRKTCHSHSANAILRRNWGLWAPIPQVMALLMGKLIVHGIRRWNIRLTLRGLKPYQTGGFFSSRGLKTWGKEKRWILHVLIMFSICHPTTPALQRPQNPKLLHLPLLLQFPAQDGLT
jgi:hypothetical protein